MTSNFRSTEGARFSFLGAGRLIVLLLLALVTGMPLWSSSGLFKLTGRLEVVGEYILSPSGWPLTIVALAIALTMSGLPGRDLKLIRQIRKSLVVSAVLLGCSQFVVWASDNPL